MNGDMDRRVTDLEYRVRQLEEDVEDHGDDMNSVKREINKVLDVVKKVQYTAYGIFIAYIFSELGFTAALKAAIGV